MTRPAYTVHVPRRCENGSCRRHTRDVYRFGERAGFLCWQHAPKAAKS